MSKASSPPLFWLLGGSASMGQVREFLDQLGKDEDGIKPLDELQVDPLIDHHVDRLFPWVTSLIQEPKYYFLAPAIASAVGKALHAEGAKDWEHRKVVRQAEGRIRLLEALLCRCLLASNPVTSTGIIGSRKMSELDRSSRLRLFNFTSGGGVAKSINMHATGRYLRRSRALFSSLSPNPEGLDGTSMMDMVVAAARDPLGRGIWWREIPPLAKAIAEYEALFVRWLRGGHRRTDRIPLSLTEGEKRLMSACLQGPAKGPVAFHQRFLKKYLQIRNADSGTNPSEFLEKIALQPRMRAFRPGLLRIATLIATVGLVRQAYNLLTTGRGEELEDVLLRLKRKRAAVRHAATVSEEAEAGLALSSLEFLQACVAARDPHGLSRTIEVRERETKPGRQKLRYRKGRVVPAKRVKNEDDRRAGDDAGSFEPQFRRENVRRVLARLNTGRRA